MTKTDRRGASQFLLVPEEHHDNSPAFQRWGKHGPNGISPEGTAENARPYRHRHAPEWSLVRTSSFVIRNSFNYASFPPVLRAKTHVTKAGHFPEMRYNASSWYANNCARFPAAKNPGGG